MISNPRCWQEEIKREILILADAITGDDLPLAAGVVVASTTLAIAAVGGVIYLVRRRCGTRNLDQPADEQVG